jgi:hypothetical protein
MFRTPESRILDLERKAGTQTDKRFLVIIDNNREEAETESFGHVLTERERISLERIEIEITGIRVDPDVVKRLEEIATRNALEPPWQQDWRTYTRTEDKPEITSPGGEPEGSQTQLQTGNERDLWPEIYAQREDQSLIRMLEGY